MLFPAQQTATLAAYSGVCKLCHWYSACLKRLREEDDLTLIPELGRSKRDVLNSRVSTIQGLAQADLEAFLAGKKTIFPGIGSSTLKKFHERANLIAAGNNARPYLKAPLVLPIADLELFSILKSTPYVIFVICMASLNGEVGTITRSVSSISSPRNRLTKQKRTHSLKHGNTCVKTNLV